MQAFKYVYLSHWQLFILLENIRSIVILLLTSSSNTNGLFYDVTGCLEPFDYVKCFGRKVGDILNPLNTFGFDPAIPDLGGHRDHYTCTTLRQRQCSNTRSSLYYVELRLTTCKYVQPR